MEKLKDLDGLVSQLVNESNKQVEKLQEILKDFLNNYYIEFGKFKIEPLLIEAYYSNKDKNFIDEAVHAARNENGKIATHARERQKDNFGKLYIHNFKNKNDGLDICLSKGTYYFSVLVKNAIINGKEFATQSQVSKIICDECQKCNEVPKCIYYNDSVLKSRTQPKKANVVFLPRKGLSKGFVDKKLAAFRLNENIDINSLAKEHKSQWKKYVELLFEINDEEVAFQEAISKYNKKLTKGDKYWQNAVKCWKESKIINETL